MDYHKLYENTYETYFSLNEKIYKKKYITYRNDGYTFNSTYNELHKEHWDYIKFIEKHLKLDYKEVYIKLFNDRLIIFQDDCISKIIEKKIKPLLTKNKEQNNFNIAQFVCSIAKLDAFKETSRLIQNNSKLFDRMFVLNDFKHFEIKDYRNDLNNLPLFIKLNEKVYPSPKQTKSKIIVKDDNEEEYLNVQDVSKLTNYAVATIYDLRHKRKIPFYKNSGKLQFKKSEILDWLEKGKGTTKNDLEAKAIEYINKNS